MAIDDPITAMLPTTPAEPPLGEYEIKDHGPVGGKQLLASFANGYGASVVQSAYSYGGANGLYELAVLHTTPYDKSTSICYRTPVTDDVLGWLSEVDVVTRLHEIARLPGNDLCTHQHVYSITDELVEREDHWRDEGR